MEAKKALSVKVISFSETEIVFKIHFLFICVCVRVLDLSE